MDESLEELGDDSLDDSGEDDDPGLEDPDKSMLEASL